MKTVLTDIFADRYEHTEIELSNPTRVDRFMGQAFLMITQQLFPYYIEGRNEDPISKRNLQAIHDKLAMELGKQWLSPLPPSGLVRNLLQIITNFMYSETTTGFDDDPVRFKERLSFVELAFREAESIVKTKNMILPERLKALIKNERPAKADKMFMLPNLSPEEVLRENGILNKKLQDNLKELNARFKQANLPLVYRNGFIQISEDEVVEASIKKPFWSIIGGPKWESVEHDMLVAIDLRDTGRTGAAASAAKALESTMKIISDEKGWSTGNEKGAGNYIDNMKSQKNGRFIEVWEGEMIQKFFSDVRNKLQHGTGSEPVIVLTKQQDDWAIETCMSWIKSLINRM